MSERRKVVSVIGNRAVEEGSLRYKLAFETGKALVITGTECNRAGSAALCAR